MSRKHNWNWLLYPAVALGIAVIGGASFMSTYSRAYNVPAASMLPNLLVGDHFWAWHGYYAEHAPERGEIALFLHRDSVFIKRVIGLPGDTIEMKAGRLWINDAEVERQEDGTFTDPEYGRTFQRYRETLPNGASYPILEADDASILDTAGPFQVPANSYFIMGDNRDNSNDSRMPDFGAVPRDRFTDRPFLIYFSRTPSRIGSGINQAGSAP